MPRKQGGIGRTGGKHKKDSTHDAHRQPKAELVDHAGAGPSRAVETLNRAIEAAKAAAAAALDAEALSVEDMQDALKEVEAEEASGGQPEQSAQAELSVPAVESYHPPFPSPPFPPPVPPNQPVRTMLRLRGSKRAQDAILAAEACELRQCWLREGIDEPLGVIEGWEELDAWRREQAQSWAWGQYLDALRAVRERFPMIVCCSDFDEGACVHGLRCECGGLQAPWPWIIHHPFASRFCECHLYLRRGWSLLLHNSPTAASSRELVDRIVAIEIGKLRPACLRAGYPGCGCTCIECDQPLSDRDPDDSEDL